MVGRPDRSMLSPRPRWVQFADTRSQRVVKPLTGQRPLAAGGLMIEVEPVEFIVLERGDHEIGVGPPVGRGENLLENLPRPFDNRHR
jgi:hypothetical protein